MDERRSTSTLERFRHVPVTGRLAIAAAAADATFVAAFHHFLGLGLGVLGTATVITALAVGMRLPADA
jgi:hypothetical protein